MLTLQWLFVNWLLLLIIYIRHNYHLFFLLGFIYPSRIRHYYFLLAYLGLRFVEIEEADVWHRDVRLFSALDSSNELLGYFYLDIYARSAS